MNKREKAIFSHEETMYGERSDYKILFDHLNGLKEFDRERSESQLLQEAGMNPAKIRNSSKHLLERILRVLQGTENSWEADLSRQILRLKILKARNLWEVFFRLAESALQLARQSESFGEEEVIQEMMIDALKNLAYSDEKFKRFASILDDQDLLYAKKMELYRLRLDYQKVRRVRKIKDIDVEGGLGFERWEELKAASLEKLQSLKAAYLLTLIQTNIAWIERDFDAAQERINKAFDLISQNPSKEKFFGEDMLRQILLGMLFAVTNKKFEVVSQWAEKLGDLEYNSLREKGLQALAVCYVPLEVAMQTGDTKEAQRLYDYLQKHHETISNSPYALAFRLKFLACNFLLFSGQFEKGTKEIARLIHAMDEGEVPFNLRVYTFILQCIFFIDRGDCELAELRLSALKRRMSRQGKLSVFFNDLIEYLTQLSKNPESRKQLEIISGKEKHFLAEHPEKWGDSMLLNLSIWGKAKIKGIQVFDLISEDQKT